jgi:hypothetical protein
MGNRFWKLCLANRLSVIKTEVGRVHYIEALLMLCYGKMTTLRSAPHVDAFCTKSLKTSATMIQIYHVILVLKGCFDGKQSRRLY